jgi:mono/diheme cytochrome c family protein
MNQPVACLALCAAMVGVCGYAAAQQQASSTEAARPVHGCSSLPPAAGANTSAGSRSSAAKAAPPRVANEAALRLEGEKRFQANCGRCHMAPHKFAPRTMAAIIRHMRVRAMLTDEDMRLILRYMTE